VATSIRYWLGKAALLVACATVLAFSAVALAKPPPPPLTQLSGALALATDPGTFEPIARPEQMRNAAIEALKNWPPASQAEEEQIKEALMAAVERGDGWGRAAAASALGVRNYGDVVPRLVALLETNPSPLWIFLANLPNGDRAPPIELVRQALRARNPGSRLIALGKIREHKLALLRSEVEQTLETATTSDVRREAALALAQFRSRESLPLLKRVFKEYPNCEGTISALSVLGSDEELPLLVDLLNSPYRQTKDQAFSALCRLDVRDPRPLCDVLLAALRREQKGDPISVVKTLVKYQDRRALSLIREFIETKPKLSETGHSYVRAMEKLGGPEAIALLNGMVDLGYHRSFGIEHALARFGDPSSGPVVWRVYLQHPVRRVISGWCATTTGYSDAGPVLKACADRDLLEQIRRRAADTDEKTEKRYLTNLAEQIEIRLAQSQVTKADSKVPK
jgi:HEAT repeat protein